MFEFTKEFVRSAHDGVFDAGGVPYVQHPMRVMEIAGGDEERKMIALLHDVVEDTDYTLEDLKEMGYSDRVVAGVDAVTKRKGKETYQEYLDRVAANEDARAVKKADLTHNSDLCRLPKITSYVLKRAEKYKSALKFLESFDV